MGSTIPRTPHLAASHFSSTSTLSRWLIDDEPGFDLRQALNARLDLLLSGLAASDGNS